MSLLCELTDQPSGPGRPLPEWIGTVAKKLRGKKKEYSATEIAEKNGLQKRPMLAVLQTLISWRIAKDGRFNKAFFEYADLETLEALYNSGKHWRA